MDDLNTMEDLQRLVVAGFTDWKQYGAVYTKRFDNLILFNYTPEAVYADRWTWLERVSRGLILNAETGEVVARGFDKFFNWFEGGRMPEPGSTIETICEKLDGSLGISFFHDGKLRIATRGSFESDQALWATEFINRVHPGLMGADSRFTLLFEIIYPANRIVVDYGTDEKLALLAVRNRETGEYLPFNRVQMLGYQYDVPVAPVHTFADMDSVLASTASIEHEGYVIEMSDGSRWKIKGEKYRTLHKIISQVSFNAVLDALMCDGWVNYRMAVPEEFWPEIDGYHAEITQVVECSHADILSNMTDDLIASFPTRKDMALWVQQQPRELQRFYFNHYDKKFKYEDLFKMIPRRTTRTRIEKGDV